MEYDSTFYFQNPDDTLNIIDNDKNPERLYVVDCFMALVFDEPVKKRVPHSAEI